MRHYNVERPHRGRDTGNNVLQVDFRPARDGPIRCRRQLGGIITFYTRDAAGPTDGSVAGEITAWRRPDGFLAADPTACHAYLPADTVAQNLRQSLG